MAFVIFLLGTMTDKLDGHLARKYGWETSLGKFLDPLADKVLITTGFICLIFVGYIKIWMVVIIVLRDIIVTMLRSYGQKIGRPIRTLQVARWKTGVQSVAIYIALAYIILLRLLDYYDVNLSMVMKIEQNQILLVLMFIATLFTAYTGVVYIIVNRHLFRKS